MSKLSRIIKNTLISLVGQLVTWASTLGLTIAYGRFLGDAKFGELYTAISFVALVGFPVELGFNRQLTRDVAEDPKKAHTYLWNTLAIKMTLWGLLYGLTFLLAWAVGYSLEQREVIAICGITLLSASCVNTFAAVHYAFERTVFPAVGLIFEKGLSALIGFLLLKYGATVQTMAFVLLGGSLIDALWVGFWFFRLNGRHFSLNKAMIRQLIHTSIPFVIYGALGVIYYRIDTVLLSLMTSASVVGWYGAAYRIFDTLLFIPNLILNAVMYPVFAKLSGNSESSKSALRTAVEKCMNLLLICSLPIGTLLIMAAPNIVGFLYHRPEFINTIPAIQGLAPGLVFLYINTLFSTIIVSTKGEKKIPIMAAAALVFNLSLNLYLIPHYRHIGAAVVTSLTELLLLVISGYFVPSYLLPLKSLKVAGKALIAALIMAGVIYLLQNWSILFLLPVSLLAYTGAAVLLRTVPREDMRALYLAVKQKGKGKEKLVEVVREVGMEDIYSQITDRMPAVPTQLVQQATAILRQWEESEFDDDATQLRPAVAARKAQARKRIQQRENNAEIADIKTKPLPAVLSGGNQREQGI